MFKRALKFGSLSLAAALAFGFSTSPNTAAADSTPFIGEVKIFAFNFCPRGWAAANGQSMLISSNNALFAILGTFFGGDGRTTFNLPDLQGRVVVGEGTGPGLSFNFLGQKAGSETAGMTLGSMPSHTHTVRATNADGDKAGPGNKILGAAPTGGTGNETIYTEMPANRFMSTQMIQSVGGIERFNNLDPQLGLLHCMAVQGVFPSRN